MRVAVMQPYFVPYAGYFRLLHACDVFVIFDTAQFLRRGWMHRNKVPNPWGDPIWLTLPLAKAPRDASVSTMAFAENAPERWRETARRWSHHSFVANVPELNILLGSVRGRFDVYALALLDFFARSLDLQRPHLVRATELGAEAPGNGGAQDRVIRLVKAVGGDVYVNPPGGRDLYDRQRFEHAGLDLTFLPEFSGATPWSILHRFFTEDRASLRAEICDQCKLTTN